MSDVNLSTSVGRWIAEHPQTAGILETLRIVCRCGG